MNNTNRALNRAFLIVVGLILLALGGGAILITTVPEWDGMWRATSPSIADTVTQLWRVGVAFAGIPHVPWVLLAIPVAALILVVLLLVFVFRQGHGRTHRVIEKLTLPGPGAQGTLTVDASLAADVIQQAIGDRRDVAAVSVSAYRVKGRPALKVAVTPRRGANPLRVLAAVEDAAESWDKVAGVRIPIVVHLAGGMRATVAKAVRTV